MLWTRLCSARDQGRCGSRTTRNPTAPSHRFPRNRSNPLSVRTLGTIAKGCPVEVRRAQIVRA